MSSSSEPPTTSHVASNLEVVRRTMERACADHGRSIDSVRLVAVSKTQPASAILEAYTRGRHRHFGENYVQELVEKAAGLPEDISWHFIGPLQSNKAALLVKSVVPRCASLTVETVATMKLATKLNAAMESIIVDDDDTNDNNNNTKQPQRLNVFLQVNTSGEDTKSGVPPTTEALVELIQDIRETCPRLCVKGLMTIGEPGDVACLDALRNLRDSVGQELELEGEETLELSMGMSGDYVEAIAAGSTNVRVGSTIFGERDYSFKKENDKM